MACFLLFLYYPGFLFCFLFLSLLVHLVLFFFLSSASPPVPYLFPCPVLLVFGIPSYRVLVIFSCPVPLLLVLSAVSLLGSLSLLADLSSMFPFVFPHLSFLCAPFLPLFDVVWHRVLPIFLGSIPPRSLFDSDFLLPHPNTLASTPLPSPIICIASSSDRHLWRLGLGFVRFCHGGGRLPHVLFLYLILARFLLLSPGLHFPIRLRLMAPSVTQARFAHVQISVLTSSRPYPCSLGTSMFSYLPCWRVCGGILFSPRAVSAWRWSGFVFYQCLEAAVCYSDFPPFD